MKKKNLRKNSNNSILFRWWLSHSHTRTREYPAAGHSTAARCVLSMSICLFGCLRPDRRNQLPRSETELIDDTSIAPTLSAILNDITLAASTHTHTHTYKNTHIRMCGCLVRCMQVVAHWHHCTPYHPVLLPYHYSSSRQTQFECNLASKALRRWCALRLIAGMHRQVKIL